MSQRNIETLKRAHEAFSAHNIDEAIKVLAANGTMTDHGRGQVYPSRAEFRNMLAGFVEMSSDIKIVDAEYIDGGDYVTARFRAVGVQDGPMAGTPYGPSNKPYTLDVCEVWHFNAEGQADEGHNYSDGLGLLMQLEHMPTPN
jgi:hypothetical protein